MTRVLLSAALVLWMFVTPFSGIASANQVEPVTKVMIDPGHGGTDPGAASNGLREKDLTLAVAKKVNTYLTNSYVVSTKLTRTTDKVVSLKERSVLANKWKADYFFSIHINSGGGTGYEDYTYKGRAVHAPNVNEESKAIQKVIHAEVKKVLSKYGVKDRGTKEANFHVLRETEMPSILTELLFIDTKQDANLLKNDKFLTDIAVAYSEGMAKALNLPKKNGDASTTVPKPEAPPVTSTPAKVYVTTDNLNLRSGAGTSYKIVTNAKKGTKITITKTTKVGNVMWGYGTANQKSGWMSMSYLTAYKAPTPPAKPAPTKPKPSVSQASNKVYTTTANLNVRSGAGSNYKVVTNAKKGSKVTVTKTKKVGKTTWAYGSVNKKNGWMSMSYLTAYKAKPSTAAKPKPKPVAPKPSVSQASNKVYTTTANLNVRSGASTKYKVVTNAKKGSKVTVTKTKKVGKTVWAYGTVNKKKGWMSMSYLAASKPVAAKPKPAKPSKPLIAKASNKVYTTTANLNVRSGAGTSYKTVTNAKKGSKVTVTKTKKVGKTVWAYGTVNKKSGWMSMTYLASGKAKPSVSKAPKKVYTTTANLNLRTGAGATYKVVTTAKKGSKITIAKTKKVGSIVWGYGSVNKKYGWASMKYMR